MERLFGWRHAFDQPVVLWMIVGVFGTLTFTSLLVFALAKLGKLKPELAKELRLRLMTWWALVPVMTLPVLAGALPTILAVGLLSMFCYREYAKATGLFREKLMTACVAVAIVLITFATLDHFYGFFVALGPLTVVVLAVTAVLPDRPKGFIQRLALGVFGFMFFGMGLGHLGYFTNEMNYRAVLLMLLLAVEANDVFAYCCGKLFGKRKLAPQTSPNKTIAGGVGAVVLTTVLVVLLGRHVFAGTIAAGFGHLIVIGLIISVGGQFGDLLLSSIKRDLGIKDVGSILPGHGGLLDRFDSLLLTAPAVFHYVGFIMPGGVGLDGQTRIITTVVDQWLGIQ